MGTIGAKHQNEPVTQAVSREVRERVPADARLRAGIGSQSLVVEHAQEAKVGHGAADSSSPETTGLSEQELDRLLDPLELTRGGIKS